MKRETAGILVLVFLVGLATVSVALIQPPAALPASAPQTEFSAERAMGYLSLFAQKPHPMGTPEHDRVRDYLMGELIRLGMNPELQTATGYVQKFAVAGSVQNIVARMKGTGGASAAVMLVAHYDSVAAGPGAGDDGSGVATLLETLHALRAGPPLKNDVIFLITDGEEDGLLGAAAFMDQHPWAKDVRLALNFEARGNAGVSQMFETSAENGQLVRELAAAAPRASGSSLTYEVYKYLPNDTDMTVFKQHGVAGLNFAFIGHWEAYHTPLDNPADLDRGSLQQHGSYALALARRFGNRDLGNLRAPDEIYFSIPGVWFVRYPASLALPLTAGALVLFLLISAGMVRAQVTTWLQMLFGFLAFLLSLIVSAAAGFGFARGVAWLHLRWLPEGNVITSGIYVLSLVAFLVAVCSGLYNLLRKKLSAEALSLGALAGWVILAGLTVGYLRGGNYLFLWPLAGGLISLLAGRQFWKTEAASWFWVVLACLLEAPIILVLAPQTHGFWVALGLTVPGAVAVATMMGLGLAALSPQMELIAGLKRATLPLGALLVGAALLALGAATVRYSEEHPKPSIQAYALDADAGKALWANSARRVDSWIAQYVTSAPQRGPLKGFFPDWLPIEFLNHEAPAVNLEPPTAALLESAAEPFTRAVSLRVSSPRHARVLSLSAPENEVLEAWVNGLHSEAPWVSRWNPGGKWHLEYANVPEAGFELKLRVKGAGPVKLVLVDRSIGLPEIPGHPFAPRSGAMMPQHSGDQTLVRRTMIF
ncbi:MAG TPA: M20/M25/M40 family metallo-hydrolase [Candidatus Acidoferrales bacterium]|nr:M20/M25/M40 family metallo-hydrolase [Candidatus Acidoferrales bacterium]